jgi:hypothetical protein
LHSEKIKFFSMNELKIDLKLVDTDFTAVEAKEVVLALFDYKIRFHQAKRFSNEERFNKDIHHSELRISELKKERERLVEFFEKADKSARITVSSKVDIIEVASNQERKTA